MEDLKVRYLGQEIVIPGDFLLAREIQTRFEKLANQANIDYAMSYYNRYENFQTFSTTGIEDGYNYIADFVDTAADILIEHGVYDADRKMLINKYGEEIFHAWSSLDAAVNIKQGQAQAKVEAERQAREYRKASRGRMVGGGFGVKGAVKGIAMAGTYNFTSGLLHSGANAIGNSISRSKSQKELQHLYENELRESVNVAIHTCVQVIGVIIIAELGLDVPDGIEERVATLFNNFPKVPQEDQPVVAAQIIALAPWDVRTYMLLLPKFGDPDGELYRLAKQASAGMLTSFNSVRKDVLSQTIKSLQPQISTLVEKTSIEDFDSAAFLAERDKFLDVIKEKAMWLGCKPEEDMTTQNLKSLEWEVSKLCREKEEATRTFNGEVYETRELAEKARGNFQQAQKLVQASKNADYQQVCENLEKVQAINDSEPKGTVWDFLDQIEEMEISARTVEGITYDTFELAEKGRTNRASVIKLIEDCEKGIIQKEKLLEDVYNIYHTEPKRAITDLVDSVLIKFYKRKKEENPTVFKKNTYQNIEIRQTVECEYNLFFCKYSLASSKEEEFVSKLEQAESALGATSLHPLSRKVLAQHLAEKRAESNARSDSWQNIRRKQIVVVRYVQCLGIFSLIAMAVLPTVKIHGEPNNFLGIITTCLNSDGLSIGCVVLLGIYIVCFILIAKSFIDSLRDVTAIVDMTRSITIFVALTGIVCLVGGSFYNASGWMYILAIGLLIRIYLQNTINVDRKKFERRL